MFGEDTSIAQLAASLDARSDQFGPFDPRTVTVAHQLAIAFWYDGDLDRAVGLLDQALEGLASSSETDHPIRIDLLSTLGKIMAQEAHWEQACVVYREVLELCVLRSGENHAASLAAQGDLALALFEIGDSAEAFELESQARQSAQIHLGKTHPVSCVLAWNRAVLFERNGDPASASKIVRDDLAWLLTEDDTALDDDRSAIRAMLAKPLKWDDAVVC